MADGFWDDGTPIQDVPGSAFDEGVGQAGAGDYADPFGIYNAPVVDVVANSGITGMPAPDSGSSGSWIPGAGGDTSTPPNRDNELTNPNGLPVPSWTPRQGYGENAAIQPLLNATAAAIATAAANAPRQVNPGLWGVPGYGWSGHFPADPNRATWFGPRKVADKYQTMPAKHPTGPRVDPSFEQIPEYSQDFDFLRNSPYEYEVPYQYFHQIGDVVTFPGNPANDNNPVGPDGGPHNWEFYRRQIQLRKALEAQTKGVPQDYFFGP